MSSRPLVAIHRLLSVVLAATAIPLRRGARLAWVVLGTAPCVCGVARADWRAGGIPVALPDDGTSTHRDVAIAPDGNGGAFIVWQSNVAGGSYTYVQRVTTGGTVAPGWPLAGAQMITGGETDHAVALADGEGGVFVAGHQSSFRFARVVVDHVDATGSVTGWWSGVTSGGGGGGTAPAKAQARPEDALLFGPSGMLPSICPNGGGGVWVAWLYAHVGWSSFDVMLAGIGRDGVPVPGGAPRSLRLRVVLNAPVVCGDGVGGAFIAWPENVNILAQHVMADGSLDPRWDPSGLSVRNATGYVTNQGIASDGSGGFIIVWQDSRNGQFQQTYAQRVLSDGTRAPGWPDSGVVVCPHPTGAGVPRQWMGDLYPTSSVIPDRAGGAFIAWIDYRDSTGTGHGDIYMQRLLGDGTVAQGWPAEGLPVCALPGDQRFPRLADDGTGGALVIWQDARVADNTDVYVQHVLASGAIAPDWPANGLAICSAPGAQEIPDLATDPASGAAIATWLDHRSGYSRTYAGLLTLDQTTAVLVSLESSYASPSFNRLIWRTSGEPKEARIDRRDEHGPWEQVDRLSPDGSGRLVFEDHDVVPGRSYGYRLRTGEPGSETVHEEVWLAVPGLTSLALHGARPNPAGHDLVLSFSLANDGPVTIELFDMGGRRVASHTFAALGAGEHTCSVPSASRLAAGVYLARLGQYGRFQVARVCLIR